MSLKYCKVYGGREQKVKKYGTAREHRVWCELPIAVDINTHEIVAAELMLFNITYAKFPPY
ncbi:hypothetical protein VIN01S_24320 [Vibrio inusitatus NBRC 102082]|uniref:Transposase DDE domain-containing protein n=1 Tax=Vibrio inusitatus NBRC 102082 TaxID=1219070 RepID=A0A4Y3HX84_9VIBR|nr:hypothetical protein VIN01S_24320 [Vibrio inusitatus NBRC 102082]